MIHCQNFLFHSAAGIVTQQDDLSPLYWHLCSDHRVFPPARKQRNIVQICTSCVHARVWCVIVNENDADDDVGRGMMMRMRMRMCV